jgi:O-antigen/teichoic acid export membrane protein
MNKIGMDGAIAYSSAARIFQAFAGVVSVFVLAYFLTGAEQGFYFTFNSILAAQIFFELGFTGIMTQYVAHEVVHLNLNESFFYEGEQRYKSRLAYLVRFCLKWYLVVAILFFVIIILVGFVYFRRFASPEDNINWQAPWTLLCFSTAIKLFQSPFTAIYTGLGKVKEMNRIAFYQQLIIPVSQWVLFAFGLKLYVIGIGSLLAVLVWWVFVLQSGLWRILFNLLKERITETISYMKEIFPYQWKIALSWVSGYFIYQLFNPVLFATEGAVIAGQMGMTVQVLNTIQSFSFSWQNTKIPRYCGLIEMKQYNELDSVFNKTVKQMVMVCSSILLLFYAMIIILRATSFSIGETVLADRFLPLFPMILMTVPVVVNQFVSSWATYLRCHKQEPFLINSVVIGILCCLSTLLLGKYWGLYGITIGYSSLILFVSLPWGYMIYNNKRKEWHGQ